MNHKNQTEITHLDRGHRPPARCARGHGGALPQAGIGNRMVARVLAEDRTV